MAERLRQQQALLAMLKRWQLEKPGREAAMAQTKEYIASRFLDVPGQSPGDEAFFESSRESTARMVSTILNLATSAQKTTAFNKAQQWMDDFTALAATPP